MADEKPKTALATVAEQLAKPVYDDAGKPLAKEVGQGLAAAGAFVRLATRPFQSMALAGHLGFDWLDQKLRKKFEDVPAEKIVEPPASVAGPLLLAAGFTSDKDETLRELYAQLLATSMHADKQAHAHPAFVEILRQLTPKEALLLKPLAVANNHPVILASLMQGGVPMRGAGFVLTALDDGLEMLPDAQAIALENFRRLGIIEIDLESSFKDTARYAPVREGFLMQAYQRITDAAGEKEAGYTEGVLKVTALGVRFLQACLPHPSPKA